MDLKINLLVRGVNWLGDAVLTTPALARLRQHFPAGHIVMLTRQKLGGLWQNHPDLDEVVEVTDTAGAWQVAARLRAHPWPDPARRPYIGPGEFDFALILPNSPRSALEVWLAGIPVRIGYARPWRNWMLSRAVSLRPEHRAMHRLSTGQVKRKIAAASKRGSAAAQPSPAEGAHQIHDYLRLAAVLGADPAPLPPRLQVSDAELRRVEDTFLSQLPSVPGSNAASA